MIELEFNGEDPFNAHVRICKYCGETFIANHALREFCPSKFARANYCKHQYKVLLAENRLTKVDGKSQVGPIVENSKQKNIRILHEIMSGLEQRMTTSDLLTATGFDLKLFDDSWTSKGKFRGVIDRYTVSEQEQTTSFKTFRIQRYSNKIFDY